MVMDWSSLRGAEELAHRIRVFWRREGYEVKTSIEVISTKSETLFGVKSDMFNGWPRGFGNGRNT